MLGDVRQRAMKNKQVYPPGPGGLPLLRNVLEFRHNQLNFLLKLEQTYAPIATIYIGKSPITLLFRPEHIRYILTEIPRKFTSREVAGGLVFGNLLLLSMLARTFSKKVTWCLHNLVGDSLITPTAIPMEELSSS
jgi:hypothetical protein